MYKLTDKINRNVEDKNKIYIKMFCNKSLFFLIYQNEDYMAQLIETEYKIFLIAGMPEIFC